MKCLLKPLPRLQPRPRMSSFGLARYLSRFSIAITASLLSAVSFAAPITDPLGDFIPSFVGPHNADLDVLSGELVFSGTQFTFNTTLAGPVGTTAGSLYVLGLDRGQGTSRFPIIAPGVLFDEVVAITGTGTATVRDLIAGTATTLPGSAVTFSGNNLNISFPLSLAPSLGLTPSNYMWNLWPRTGATNDNQISDFAPDNSDARVTVAAVPEPATIALLGLGCLSIIVIRRQGRMHTKAQT